LVSVSVTIGGESFEGRLQHELAPRTCARFQAMLPIRQSLIHARWSGEACWVPLGALDLGLGPESPVANPGPGEILLYPGGLSETEILIAYGAARFASVHGGLAGNPLLKITDGLDRLAALGRDVLWRGAREILFEPQRV
jgi:hypothetical protein